MDMTSDSDPIAWETGVTESDTKEWKPSTHELLIMITLAIVTFMISLDACVVATSLHAIVTALDGSTTEGFWVGTSYFLATAVVMPTIAAVSDVFGRPICLTASLVAFTIGSLICCLSQTMAMLLAGRTVQGVGCGGITVLTSIIFTDLVPLRQRPKCESRQASWTIGSSAGPLIGGAISEKTTWRWMFYIMFPFCGYGLICVPWLLTLKPREMITTREKLRRIDWIGSLAFMVGTTLFLMAISWGGTQFAWNSAGELLPLCLGLVGIAATLVWGRYFTGRPLLNTALFSSASATFCYICGGIQGLVLFGELYYIPFYFIAVKGFSPIYSGVALLPVMLMAAPSAIVTGAIVTRTNRYQEIVWSGWILTTLASGLMIRWDADTTTPVWVVNIVLLGLGQGAIATAQNFATQALCRPGLEADAASVYIFARHFGVAVGLGVSGTTFQNIMAMKLEWEGLPRYIASQAEAFVDYFHSLPTDAPPREAAIKSYVFGLQGVYAFYTGISGLALLLSLFIRRSTMDKTLSRDHELRAVGGRRQS
ncbi:hypothetical protein PFICI_12548 [Pestalotiopsis fici W106-1]|uniref:Major facilitator superfamily (MFS) profile domain-containing protein n=1 Tax=Pestalotiopsis fici (strain W106-1 / CGMCC3.15140) TaxID=1229662 RepID=W3WP73_PESFW|nr:uncharacterized protein PFICI_12548 [Pestalotiopsis fici W106-1]ETS75604.1 hypothetical protein PFICI_12548 [Pestalotiopsis fici W106-1]